jgi:3',5'-cyclic AMP phosphodiesterase CpdA
VVHHFQQQSQRLQQQNGAPIRDERGFPFVRRRGAVALLGVSTACPTPWAFATGRVGAEQLARLARLLEQLGAQTLFRVVLIHHPPVRGATATHKRLFGIARFQKIIRKHGAELILHGHTHLPTTHWIVDRNRAVPVVGVAAAGQATGSAKPAAQYNLIEIDGKPGDWRICLTRRGITGPTLEMADIGKELFSPGTGSLLA